METKLRSTHYVLRGREVVPASLMEWAMLMEDGEARRVAYDNLPGGGCVSTVFIGLDYSLEFGPPRVFETMIFGGEHDGCEWRYATYEEAEQGHREAVELVTGG